MKSIWVLLCLLEGRFCVAGKVLRIETLLKIVKTSCELGSLVEQLELFETIFSLLRVSRRLCLNVGNVLKQSL